MSAARWKLILYLSAIFVAGGASGWMVAVKTTQDRAFRNFRHEEVAHKMKGCLHSELQLTDDQRRKIDDIVDDTADQMKSVQGQQFKRIAELVSNRNERIMAVLNPEQREIFRKNEERRQKEIREKFRTRAGRDGDKDDSRRRDRVSTGDRCETNHSSQRNNKQGQQP